MARIRWRPRRCAVRRHERLARGCSAVYQRAGKLPLICRRGLPQGRRPVIHRKWPCQSPENRYQRLPPSNPVLRVPVAGSEIEFPSSRHRQGSTIRALAAAQDPQTQQFTANVQETSPMQSKYLFPLVAVAGLILAGAQDANAALFRGMFRSGCCQTSCCEPSCAAEPTCCAAAPTCAAEPACCDTCCRPTCCQRIRAFLHNLCHHHRRCCNSCCETSCGCAAEPACGCGY